MEQLNQKSILLTSYLEFLLENNKFNQQKDNLINFIQITPKDQKQRGCQLSLKFNCQINKIHKKLSERGIVVKNKRKFIKKNFFFNLIKN